MLNLSQVVCPLACQIVCPVGLTTYHLLFIYLYILLIAIWITVHVEFMSGCMSTKFYVHLYVKFMSSWVNYLPSTIYLFIYFAYCYLDNRSCSGCMSTKFYVHLVTSG